MDGKIHIPARRASANPQGVIKITPDAYEALIEVMNETGMSAPGGERYHYPGSE